MKTRKTSESVTCGHPDKICDQIADRILDEILRKDPLGRVACEVAINNEILLIRGEITTIAEIEYETIARTVLQEIGYTEASDSNNLNSIQIIVSLNNQSIDIAQGLLDDDSCQIDEMKIGAGDQGLMVGYACIETKELMPLPIVLAYKLTQKLEEMRKERIMPYLQPDGKAQVTVLYENDLPISVDTVVISTQHDENITLEVLRNDVKQYIINKVIPENLLSNNTRILINPAGRFVVGGPKGDSGLTGRKIIVDTYGGVARHGGGSFSGKDATKVDRSGAYLARYLAKNIVAAGFSTKCEVEVAYAIGISDPVAVQINTFKTGIYPDSMISEIVMKSCDLTVRGIIDRFHLEEPIYSKTSVNGHFGKEDLPWEQIDLSKILKIKTKSLNITLDEWFEKLTIDSVKELTELEILQFVMENPKHKGQYGFRIQGQILLKKEDSSIILFELMNRISKIPNIAITSNLSERKNLNILLQNTN